jgi:ABC-type uncharacterized transport system permease subunit
MSPGYGYSGIVIAMLASLNPHGVVLAAIFVAGVIVGADSMSRIIGVPSYLADVIVAISLLSMLVATMLTRYKGPRYMSELYDIVASPAFWIAVLRIATPLILGTLGVLLCERAGVLNLGIEGIMVAGAFCGWLAVFHAPVCGPACWLRRAPARSSAAARRAHGCAGVSRSTYPGWA